MNRPHIENDSPEVNMLQQQRDRVTRALKLVRDRAGDSSIELAFYNADNAARVLADELERLQKLHVQVHD